MIVENVLVPDDIGDVRFCCDLQKCKGACCVEGDAGAPLNVEEISLLEDDIEKIIPFMTEEGIKEVKTNGVFDYDADGNFVTPLIHGIECAFVYFQGGIAYCAIEKAFEAGKIPFRKPVSCHLYPIRINQKGGFDSLVYHKWGICKPAVENGNKNGILLIDFLSTPLIRKFGRNWYNRLLKLLFV